MKKMIKVEIEKSDKIVTELFNIDETIFDGLYLTMSDKKVNDNIKKFDIKKREANSFNNIGIQYSKNFKFVILTFNIKYPTLNFYGQFLINEKVNQLDILNCDHPALKGMKPILMDSCDLAKIDTMEDLLKLKRLFK